MADFSPFLFTICACGRMDRFNQLRLSAFGSLSFLKGFAAPGHETIHFRFVQQSSVAKPSATPPMATATPREPWLRKYW